MCSQLAGVAVGAASAPAASVPEDTDLPEAEKKARIPHAGRLEVPGGIIKFYASDGRFEATCLNPSHGNCILSRFNRKRSKMAGRPVGFMAAWLSVSVMCEDKEEHWEMVDEVEGHIAVRQEHRNSVADLEGGVALLQCERDSEALGIRAEPATARG